MTSGADHKIFPRTVVALLLRDLTPFSRGSAPIDQPLLTATPCFSGFAGFNSEVFCVARAKYCSSVVTLPTGKLITVKVRLLESYMTLLERK